MRVREREMCVSDCGKCACVACSVMPCQVCKHWASSTAVLSHSTVLQQQEVGRGVGLSAACVLVVDPGGDGVDSRMLLALMSGGLCLFGPCLNAP